ALPGASEAIAEWSASAHARGGVACTDCHRGARAGAWVARPSTEACANCHTPEREGWLAGKHGMRVARELTPMRPTLARLAMRDEAAERELGCTSCHAAHRFDRPAAATEACLGCHADEHTLAYGASPHAQLWADELTGRSAPGTGVSCATCHLPRFVVRRDGVDRVAVQHNQNHNLRPNEKMIRDACLHCHGLAFAIDALADEALVERNFLGRPSRHVESIDMATRREVEHAAAEPATKEETR
ncbi:MAG: multiheme c-type cytochrome, partial [Candidatus Binatia bacterium]